MVKDKHKLTGEMANSEGGESRKRNFTTLLLVGIKREGGKEEPCMLLAKGGENGPGRKLLFSRLLFFCELAVGGGFGRVEKCCSLSFCLFKEGPTCLFVQFFLHANKYFTRNAS